MKILYCFLTFFSLSCNAFTQLHGYQLYFLCVGNGHYSQGFVENQDGFEGFSSLQSAGYSALAVASFLRKSNVKYGQILLSSPSELITKDRMINALDSLIKRVNADSLTCAKPLIIFYYCGHGVIGGFYNTHYLIPGDFSYKYKYDESFEGNMKNTATLTAHAIASIFTYLTVKSALKNPDVPFLFILDCCTEGSLRSFNPNVAFKMKDGTLSKIPVRISNFMMNRFSVSNISLPILYAGPPGEYVETKVHPFNKKKTLGPICRRVLLLGKKKGSRNFTLTQWIDKIIDGKLDTLTKVPYYKGDWVTKFK